MIANGSVAVETGANWGLRSFHTRGALDSPPFVK